MQHDEKLGTGLIHHVVPQGGLAMQHDEKLGTMKLIMLYYQGGPNGYNILILILVPCAVSWVVLSFSTLVVAFFKEIVCFYGKWVILVR
jgi:membrane glycosyltransferase